MNNKIAVPLAVEEVVTHEAIVERMHKLEDSAVVWADPRPWIKDRPLTSCLLAAGAGVVLAMLAGGHQSATPGQTGTDGNHPQARCQGHRSLGALLAATLVSTFKPKIGDLIHTAVGELTPGTEKG